MVTDLQDLVLIYVSDKPATYARIEAIDPDVKPGWWRVKLLLLTVPLQMIEWILEREQIDGKPFTMGGTPVRLERVVPPEMKDQGAREPLQEVAVQDEKGKEGQVISIKGRRKQR